MSRLPSRLILYTHLFLMAFRPFGSSTSSHVLFLCKASISSCIVVIRRREKHLCFFQPLERLMAPFLLLKDNMSSRIKYNHKILTIVLLCFQHNVRNWDVGRMKAVSAAYRVRLQTVSIIHFVTFIGLEIPRLPPAPSEMLVF